MSEIKSYHICPICLDEKAVKETRNNMQGIYCDKCGDCSLNWTTYNMKLLKTIKKQGGE